MVQLRKTEDTIKRNWTAKHIILLGLGGYVIANVAAFFFFNLFFLSPWHYRDHNPAPIPVTRAEDNNFSIAQIEAILDEIDLAYSGREPTKSEQTVQAIQQAATVVFFPATFAIMIKEFIGYMGPPTEEQLAFTLSVKRRYNHLARLAIAKGMKRDGYFFREDSQLEKRNGAPFKGNFKLTSGAKSCGLEGTARSPRWDADSDGVKTRLSFVNKSDEKIKVFWLNYKGKRKFYKMLGPGAAYTQQTFINQPWLVTNADDVCVGLYFARAEFKEIVIR